MEFIDRLWRLLPALALTLVLLACASAPPEPPPEKTDETEQEEPQAPSALPEGPVTPNPYERMSVSVSDRARTEFRAALDAMEAENWERAAERLTAMTERYPSLSGPWVNLGKVRATQGQTEEAVAALEQALSLNPKNLDAYNQLALLKREAGEFERAEALYRQALEVWPFHARTHLNLGILLDLYRGEGEQALLHYRAYQQRQEEPDRRVAGWIVDLQRRLDAGEGKP